MIQFNEASFCSSGAAEDKILCLFLMPEEICGLAFTASYSSSTIPVWRRGSSTFPLEGLDDDCIWVEDAIFCVVLCSLFYARELHVRRWSVLFYGQAWCAVDQIRNLRYAVLLWEAHFVGESGRHRSAVLR